MWAYGMDIAICCIYGSREMARIVSEYYFEGFLRRCKKDNNNLFKVSAEQTYLDDNK